VGGSRGIHQHQDGEGSKYNALQLINPAGMIPFIVSIESQKIASFPGSFSDWDR
jgi:hypothetical protein